MDEISREEARLQGFLWSKMHKDYVVESKSNDWQKFFISESPENQITPGKRILILHRLIHHATDLYLYSAVKLYCREIINDIQLLERYVREGV